MDIFALKHRQHVGESLFSVIIEHFSGSDNVEIISGCTSRYAQNNYTHFFEYLIYRVIQAALAIFGQSEWQKARELLANNWKLKKVELFVDDNIKTELQWKYLADGTLTAFTNFYNDPKLFTDFNNSLNEWRHGEAARRWAEYRIRNDIRLVGVNCALRFQTANPSNLRLL